MSLFSGPALHAEVSSRPAKSRATLTKSLAEKPKSLLAEIEIRPSWNATDSRFFTLNYAELGFIGKKFQLSYQQQFFTEISQYGASPTDHPFFRLYDGYVRLRFDNVWRDEKTKTNFSYESRLFTPTDSNKADNGLITIWQNHFKFSHEVSPAVTMVFKEVPALHVYTDGGSIAEATATSAAKTIANPLFENQVWLELDWAIPKSKWSFSFPILYSAKLFRDYDPAAENNAGWTHWMEILPELDYAVDKNVTLGLAYESGNFFTLETSADPTRPAELTSGTLQFVFRSRL